MHDGILLDGAKRFSVRMLVLLLSTVKAFPWNRELPRRSTPRELGDRPNRFLESIVLRSGCGMGGVRFAGVEGCSWDNYMYVAVSRLEFGFGGLMQDNAIHSGYGQWIAKSHSSFHREANSTFAQRLRLWRLGTRPSIADFVM